MIDVTLSNCYNNCMGLARKSSKIVLTSIAIAGTMMSSCSYNDLNGGPISWLHKAWDWLTGQPSRSQREKLKKANKLAEEFANPSKALANVNIGALPKDVKKCFKKASAYSGVPLLIMYTFTYGETDFHAGEVDKNDSPVKWDCGMTQDNVKENVCPLAYRFTLGIGKWHSRLVNEQPKLFKAIQELGLKYVGGGSSGGNCANITHNEAVDYCSEVGTAYTTSVTPSNPVCLGIMVGAYVMAKDYHIFKYNEYGWNGTIEKYIRESGVEQQALADAGKYADWIYVAYTYNGVQGCYGVKCYFYTFAEHLRGIENGIINIAKKL